MHSNTLPSTPRCFAWSLPFRFSDQNVLCISHFSHACYMLRPCHPLWLDHRRYDTYIDISRRSALSTFCLYVLLACFLNVCRILFLTKTKLQNMNL
jgi:hypothetical protein